MLKTFFKRFIFCILNPFFYLIIIPAAVADQNADFAVWLEALKSDAKAAQISEQTIDETFKNAQYLPSVIVLDRGQPEFISTFISYVEKRVNTSRIAKGRALLQEHETLLAQVETQYGVPKQILLAFWGLETNYGSNKGNYGLPSALATLAFEGRRSHFFRAQLFDTMRIVDAGHNQVSGMRGSWAGAMGHMQFMPSTLLKYGVDADEDSRIDIWASLPDAFASAANYLREAGWRKAEVAAIEVRLPNEFDYSFARLNHRQHALHWSKLGVLDVQGNALPELAEAAILLPQGRFGPAFMVFHNFDVIMDWNRSVNYALSVVHLSNQLITDKPIVAGEFAEKEALSFNQMWALQGKLNELGFDSGQPDGFPGLKTQAAIRQYQAVQNIPQDGYASPSLYQRLLKP